MKRLIPLLIAVVIAAHPSKAGEKKELDVEEYGSLSVGVSVFNIDGDIGGRYYLTTPYWGDFALRLSYFEQETDFGPPGNRYDEFAMAGLGLVLTYGDIRFDMRSYIDVGIVEMLDNSKLSSEKRSGYYGMIGFEHLLFGPIFRGRDGFSSIRLGIGWLRTYSKADRIPGEPIYAHGSTVNGDFVFYF